MKTKTFIKTLTIVFYLAGGTVFAAEKPLMRANPFELPRGIYSKDNIPVETPKTLRLEVIFTIKGQKITTISGQNFIKGDFAFGKRVVQIFKNRVVLDDEGKEESLILEGAKFTIRKHMQNLSSFLQKIQFLYWLNRMVISKNWFFPI
jgi:hypothetical protein